MILEQALEELTTTYQSLDLVARGLVVDAKEVAGALALAAPDTAEFVALSVLSKYNPYTPQKKTTKNADTVE